MVHSRTSVCGDRTNAVRCRRARRAGARATGRAAALARGSRRAGHADRDASGDPAAAADPGDGLRSEAARLQLGQPAPVRRRVADAAADAARARSSTCHPDHVKSLFTAKPEHAPSLTGESPLRPIVGPNSVLTANGERHMRQRRLLLPALPRRGDRALLEMIARGRRARDRRAGRSASRFALAPRMQAITLDVIMAGIFGIEGSPRAARPSAAARRRSGACSRDLDLPARAARRAAEHRAARSRGGLLRAASACSTARIYAVIAQRRARGRTSRSAATSSRCCCAARDEDGEPLSDEELRDELADARARRLRDDRELARVDLVSGCCARPTPTSALRERGALASEEAAERTSRRRSSRACASRPVIPIDRPARERPVAARRVRACPPAPRSAISILALHHREDLYPEPFAFRPERWLGPQARHLRVDPVRRRHPALPRRDAGDGRAAGRARGDGATRSTSRPRARSPSAPLHRNVTMIPGRGGEVVLRAKH